MDNLLVQHCFRPFSQVIMFQARHQKRLLTYYQQRVRDVVCTKIAEVCWCVCVCVSLRLCYIQNKPFHQLQNEKLEDDMKQMTRWVKIGLQFVFMHISELHFMFFFPHKGSWMNRAPTLQSWKCLLSIRGTAQSVCVCIIFQMFIGKAYLGL